MYREGVAYVSVTSTGIGERAGNACLEGLAAALREVYQCDLLLDQKVMADLTKCVSRASGREIFAYKPVIGASYQKTRIEKVG